MLVERLAAALGAALPRRPVAGRDAARILARGRAEEVGGLLVLRLAGTPYEMGYQHGVLARDRIHAFRDAAYAYMRGLVETQLRVPRPLSGALTRPLLAFQAAAYAPTVAPALREEMRGIADGAGIHPVEVLLATSIWEMYLVGGCSEFAACGAATADGSMLHGYNYDLMAPEHALINPALAMMFFRPDDGIPFSTLNHVGSIGVNAGMNDRGIAVAWDNTYTSGPELIRDAPAHPTPFIVVLRHLLQRAATIDEAVQIVDRALPRPLADIIIVSSAEEGRAVAVETAGAVRATRAMRDDVVFSTNCFRSPELAPHDRLGPGRDDPAEEAAVFPRHVSYATLLERHRGSLDAARAVDILRDPWPREARGEAYHSDAPRSTICRDVTGWSLVLQAGHGLVWASDGQVPAPHGRFFAFDQRAGGVRVPALDLEPSGYRDALRAADAFLSGDREAARNALDAAVKIEGETAPLLLFRAALGDEGASGRAARAFPGAPAGRIARTWIGEASEDASVRMPFPSAISIRFWLEATAARIRPA